MKALYAAFVARLHQLGGLLGTVFIGAAVFLSDPNVQLGLQQIVPPKYIYVFFIGLGILTEIAHLRRRDENDRDKTDGSPCADPTDRAPKADR